MVSTCNTQQSFLDLFDNLGLSQLIKEPTHEKGNTLDLILTDRTDSITDLKVLAQNSICKSDHFPITFKLTATVNRKKSSKRQIYNFKKANWTKLNEDFSNVEWNDIFNRNNNVEIAWTKFKRIFF